jgi:ribonuclease D
MDPMDVPVIIVDRQTDLNSVAIAVINNADTLALGCEGVEAGIPGGTLTVVQLASPDICLLFDIVDLQHDSHMHPHPPHPALVMLKRILESKAVTKIIHDCKWASHALSKQCNITLTNVHDTSAWHSVLTAGDAIHLASLNDTLRANGLKPNKPRDALAFKANQCYWAQRPFTAQMKEWASQVSVAFAPCASRRARHLPAALHALQLATPTTNSHSRARARSPLLPSPSPRPRPAARCAPV